MNDSAITEFDMLCDTILGINNNIQSVSIINKHGRPVEYKVQGNPSSQAPEQKNEMFFMQCALTISMGRDFDEDFGEIGYIHTNRKNLSMFSFPLFDNIILVTSKAATGPIALARKISTIIKRYRLQHLAAFEKNMLQQNSTESIIQVQA